MKPDIKVVRVTEAIADPLATFFQKVWSDERNAADVRNGLRRASATNPSVPGEDPPATAFLRDGEVLGYIGTIPVTFWNGEREIPGLWLKGFMVVEEHRNGPVGFAVLKELLKHVGVSGIMTVAPPARRLFQAVGYADCGTLPNYVSPLRPSRMARNIDVAGLGLGLPAWMDRTSRVAQRIGLASLGGLVAGVALSVMRGVRGRGIGKAISVDGTLPTPSDLDALWVEAKQTFGAGAVRDGRFLPWRYAPAAGATYEAVAVRDKRDPRRLSAIAVVRRPKKATDPRLRGLRVATLSDIVFRADEPAAGLAALAGAERVARRMGADALLCSASHPAIEHVLRRRGGVRLPGNVHLMIRDPEKQANLPTDAGVWWVTRGDASSDEAF